MKKFYQKLKNWKIVVFVIVINVALLQLLLESGLALFMVPVWPTYFLPHHYPNYSVKTTAGPVSASWVSNSQGFHDIEHKTGKQSENIRIVTIGDSFLDGPQQTPLPSALNQLLEKKQSNIEVINLSRPGIDTHLYYLLFKYALETYEPDIILVFIYEGNDFRRMDKLSPAIYDHPVSFFKPYPYASYYSSVFPRSSILISDLLKGDITYNRWTPPPPGTRWGKGYKPRNLEQVAKDITQYIQVDTTVVQNFLLERLTQEEITELTQFGVRIDLLAYMLSIELNAKFTPKLGIKKHRPEISNDVIASKQVKSVLNFLHTMHETSLSKKIEFYSVLIPTSYADPSAFDMYKRLGAAQDPLFVKTRTKQAAELQQMLLNKNMNVIDLRETIQNTPNSYLKFDTHWNNKGVAISAEHISNHLLNNSKLLANNN